MDEDEILKRAERYLGRKFNPGNVIAFAKEIYGQGFSAGARAMRKSYDAPAPKKAAKRVPRKRAVKGNPALKTALDALLPERSKK